MSEYLLASESFTMEVLKLLLIYVHVCLCKVLGTPSLSAVEFLFFIKKT